MTTDNRTSLIHKNILASALMKAVSGLSILLMVPLSVRMLGVHDSGVWLTLSSLLVWFDMIDVGLGNGLRNAVAVCVARGDHDGVRRAVSSVMVMLGAIILPVIVLLLLLVGDNDMYFAMIIAVGPTFVLRCVGNMYMGLQLPAVNNVIVGVGQVLSLVVMGAAYWMGSRSLFVVACINTAVPLLVWIVASAYTFWMRYPEYRPSLSMFDMSVSRRLLSTGLQFFAIQLCSVVLFFSVNLIISHMFSPSQVTVYQSAYRYLYMLFVACQVVIMPFWNASTDAYARGDIQWIRQASHRLNLMLVGVAVIFCVMVACAPVVYHFWIGDEVVVPQSLTASMALYLFVLIVSQRYSFFLNGIGELRIQMVFIMIAAAAFLPLVWVADMFCHSVITLVLVMTLVNVPGLIANVWKFNSIVKAPEV